MTSNNSRRARAQRRVIFSYNYYDFELIARREAEARRAHSGIIVSYHQYATAELGGLASTLVALLDRRDSADLANAFLVVPRLSRKDE